jgi:PAS domain S-box-containing protein
MYACIVLATGSFILWCLNGAPDRGRSVASRSVPVQTIPGMEILKVLGANGEAIASGKDADLGKYVTHSRSNPDSSKLALSPPSLSSSGTSSMHLSRAVICTGFFVGLAAALAAMMALYRLRLRRAETALCESEERFRLFMDNSPAIAWIKDETGRPVYLNRTYEERFGVRLADCSGSTKLEIWPPPPFKESGPALSQVEEATESAVTADGKDCYWLNSKFAFRDATGKTFLAGTGLDITERRKAEEALKRYARQLITQEETLRKSIANELHDDVGQEITCLLLNLALVGNKLAADSELQSSIEDSRELAREIYQTVRNLMVSLHPPLLDQYGLVPALNFYVDQLQKRTDTALTVDTTAGFPRLGCQAEMALFRVTQEALNNIVKHAEATKVVIGLKREEQMIRLAIVDDGKGFCQNESGQQAYSGWGLAIMRERTELIGGSFRLDAVPGKGTSVTVELQVPSHGN